MVVGEDVAVGVMKKPVPWTTLRSSWGWRGAGRPKNRSQKSSKGNWSSNPSESAGPLTLCSLTILTTAGPTFSEIPTKSRSVRSSGAAEANRFADRGGVDGGDGGRRGGGVPLGQIDENVPGDDESQGESGEGDPYRLFHTSLHWRKSKISTSMAKIQRSDLF